MSTFGEENVVFGTQRLHVISRSAQAYTLSVLAMHEQAIQDPEGVIYTHECNSIEKRIRHSKRAGVLLQVVLGQEDITAAIRSPEGIDLNTIGEPYYRQLGVIDQDGMMLIGLKQREIPFLDFTKDPFVRMILDYFGSHYTALS